MGSTPSYIGTFSKDDLPSKIKSQGSAVINLDNFGNRGTHWVAVFNSPSFEYTEYYDSFGLPPPIEIEKYLSSSGKDILYNTRQIQQVGTTNCGQLCINYILSRLNGIEPYDIVYY